LSFLHPTFACPHFKFPPVPLSRLEFSASPQTHSSPFFPVPFFDFPLTLPSRLLSSHAPFVFADNFAQIPRAYQVSVTFYSLSLFAWPFAFLSALLFPFCPSLFTWPQFEPRCHCPPLFRSVRFCLVQSFFPSFLPSVGGFFFLPLHPSLDRL